MAGGSTDNTNMGRIKGGGALTYVNQGQDGGLTRGNLSLVQVR